MSIWRNKMTEKVLSLLSNIFFVVFYSFAFRTVYNQFPFHNNWNYVWPGMTLIFVSMVVMHFGYHLLYHFEPAFFMQFKTNQEEWPWKSRPIWWAKKKKQFIKNYVSFFKERLLTVNFRF